MKKTFDIYTKDIKNIATNWIVAVLIGGLVVLPSLYAWLNIKASWDPYGQTEQIPIGVVDEDKGADVRNEHINVGETLVNTLKENQDMNWQFTNRDKAIREVEYGNYFAVIIIPKDFSKQLATVVSANPEKAEIDYYVNEKINAIAPKITDKGVSVIVDEVSSEFISTVNGVIFDMFNKIGLELEEDQPDIKKFEDYLFTLEEKLPSLHQSLTDTNKDADEAKKIVHGAMDKLPEAKSLSDEGAEALETAMNHLQKGEQLFDELSPKISDELAGAQTIIQDINEVIEQAKGHGEIKEKLKNKLTEQVLKVDESVKNLEVIRGTIGQLQEQLDDEEWEKQKQLEDVKENISIQIAALNDIKNHLLKVQDTKEKADEVLAAVAAKAKASSEKAEQFINKYDTEIKPQVVAAVQEVKKKLTSAKGMVQDIQTTIPKVEKLLNSTDGHLNEGQDVLHKVLGEFPYVQEKVKGIADRLRDLKEEASIQDIIELLKNNPEAERGFFEEPVHLNKNEVFPIENYGTGMAPFYTVLAIWVGALLLISMLSTDLPDAVHPQAMYFGRLMTFVTVGLLQTVLVTSGDMLLLDVTVQHPMWFILFGLFISFVFMIIVYTVVSIFGDVGKAIAIVLLVLQIAGAGGTYPVMLLPEFFQMINPFLPFTYAIDLMREALGGIIWHRVRIDVTALAIFGVLFLLMGTFLKKPSNKLMNKLLASKDSRLFH